MPVATTRTRVECLLACLVFLLGGCASETNRNKVPADVHDPAECAQTVPAFTRTIEHSTNPSELAQAYYYRGECFSSEGRYREAFADYYAARAIGCSLERQGAGLSSGPRPSGADLVMSMLCREAGPKKLAATGSRLTETEREEARHGARERLPAEYRPGGPD
jgi:hypothetical protein